MNGLKTNCCGLFKAGENGPRPGERKPMGINGGVDYHNVSAHNRLNDGFILTGYAWNENPGIDGVIAIPRPPGDIVDPCIRPPYPFPMAPYPPAGARRSGGKLARFDARPVPRGGPASSVRSGSGN